MQANPKAKKMLKRIVLPLYGVIVVAVIVAGIVFHEKRTIDQIDTDQETFYLLESHTLRALTSSESEPTAETEVRFPKGSRIGHDFIDIWRYNIDKGYLPQDTPIAVTGTGSIIAVNLTLPLVLMNFVVLVVILWMLLWDPIIQVLDKRAETIKNDLDGAASEKAQAEKTHAEYVAQLRSSRAERAELIEKGEHLGNEQSERIVQRARDEADRIIAEARSQIEIEIERARAELTTEIGEMAAALAERILRREITADDHRQLVDGFLKELDTASTDLTA